MLAVRERRDFDTKLSQGNETPDTGKRDEGRGGEGRPSACQTHRINYLPRPHVKIRLQNRQFLALIDTRSETSCIDAETLALLFPRQTPGLYPTTTIKLADNSQGKTKGSLFLDVRINARSFQHRFLVLERLETPVIIGIDLWARACLTLTPPKAALDGGGGDGDTRFGTFGLTVTSEEAELNDFLKHELAKFEGIRGPTSYAAHNIKFSYPRPIKQRYDRETPLCNA